MSDTPLYAKLPQSNDPRSWSKEQKNAKETWDKFNDEEQDFYRQMFQSFIQKKQLQFTQWKEASYALNNRLWDLMDTAILPPEPTLIEDPSLFKLWRTRTGSILLSLYSAELQSQEPTPSTSDNPLDVNNLQALLDWSTFFTNIVTKFQGTEDYKNWIGDAIAYGNGFLSMKWDALKKSNREKVQFEYLKPTQVFQDPNAVSLEACDWVATIRRSSKTAIINAYESLNPEVRQLMEDNCQSFQEVTLEWDFFVNTFETQPTMMVNYDNQIVDLIIRYKRIIKSGRYQIQVDHFAGFKKIYTRILDIDEYPILALYEFKDGVSFFGTGTITNLVPTQKVINMAKTLEMAQLERNSFTVLCVPRDAGVDENDWQNALSQNGSVVLIDNIEQMPKYITPPIISEEAAALSAQYKEDLAALGGVNDVYEGQRPGSITSASGVQALLDRSEMSDVHLKHSLTSNIIRMYKLMLSMYASNAKTKFSATLPVKNLSANGQKVINTMLDPEVLKGDIDIVLTTSPLDGATKQRDFQQLLQIISVASNNPAFTDDLKGISLLDIVGASSLSNKNIIEENLLNQNQQVLVSKAVEIVNIVKDVFWSQIQANKGNMQNSQLSVQQLTQAVAQLIAAPLADYSQIIQQIQQQDMEQQAQSQQQGPGQGGTQEAQPQAGFGSQAPQPNQVMAMNGQTPQTSGGQYQNAQATLRTGRKGD